MWQGVLAGGITFLLVALPTAAILYAAQTGSIGTVSTMGFGGLAVVVLGTISGGAGYVVARAYRRDPGRRPGDVWTSWFSGLVTLVLGSWFAPFVVLFVFVDSDHSLAERAPLVFLTWTVAHCAVAVLAAWVAKSLWKPPHAAM
jgi:hypothetical protein